MDSQQEIANRIRTLYDRLHLAQSPFAAQAGISPTNLAKMLKGNMKITEKTLFRIANRFNVHYQWLATGEGEMMDAERMNEQDPSGNETANTAFTIAADLLTKTLDELSAQRSVTENSQRLLEDALKINAELAQSIVRLLNEKL